jgi:hypothetical protein
VSLCEGGRVKNSVVTRFNVLFTVYVFGNLTFYFNIILS